MEVFFTYVWGGNTDQGTPLTFTNKASRTIAIRNAPEGSLVFGIVSQNPVDPEVRIPEAIRGRVVSAWQISHAEANTADYGIEARNAWDELPEGGYRWPFALQPIRTWRLNDPPLFKELQGYSNETHTQQAVTSVESVNDELAQSLLDVLEANGVEIPVMEPRYRTVAQRVQVLRQRHPFAGSAYSVSPDTESTNYVYVATLGPKSNVLKIGHSTDPEARVDQFNKYRLAEEKQWILEVRQPIGTIEAAIEVETRLGELFSNYRTQAHNQEIFVGLDATTVLTRLANL